MQFDAVVIGGSFAGLSAATYLARGMRSVCVIDSGTPRNRFADHSHGFLSRDGAPPHEILEIARKQVTSYPEVRFVEGEAASASPVEGGFVVQMSDGAELTGSRLVLAFGISDQLPELTGIAERWGKTVNHCPYCHGYEFGKSPRGVLHTSVQSPHQARVIQQWGPTTYFLNGASIGSEIEAELTAAGVTIDPDPVDRLVGDGVELEGVQLAGGRLAPIAALYIAPQTNLNSDIAEQLGCAIDDGPLGPVVRTDDLRATTVPGVYAAGDIVRSFHAITLATADGMTAASAANFSLFGLG